MGQREGEKTERARELAQLVMCLPCKHENPNLGAQHPHKKPGKPKSRKRKSGAFWLSSKLRERPCVQKMR